MGRTEGFFKEDEMIHFLNKKRVVDLSPSLHTLVKMNFGVLEPDEIVTCDYGQEHTKCDFVITYQGKQKGVSLKTGKAEVMHTEKISTFIPFLRSVGVSEESLRTLLLFHFGDGTLDGTGKKRYSTEEVMMWLGDRVKRLNNELNGDKELMKRILERILFQGVDVNALAANCIYIGSYEDGVCATKKQIYKYVDKRGWDYYVRPHVGPIQFRPWVRYVGTGDINIEKRIRIQCHWPNFRSELEYAGRHFDYYTPIRHRTYEE